MNGQSSEHEWTQLECEAVPPYLQGLCSKTLRGISETVNNAKPYNTVFFLMHTYIPAIKLNLPISPNKKLIINNNRTITTYCIRRCGLSQNVISYSTYPSSPCDDVRRQNAYVIRWREVNGTGALTHVSSGYHPLGWYVRRSSASGRQVTAGHWKDGKPNHE